MASRTGLVCGLALALMGVGCDDFLDFDTLRCGNGVIEPAADEDCDGLPGGSPFRCGAPGTAAACRLVCESHAECPSGWRCGAAGVCAAAAGRFAQPVVTRLDGESVALADLDGDGRPDVVTNQRESLGVGYGRGDGAFEVIEAVPVPRAVLPPAVGDADGDGRADVALLDGNGLMVYRGTEARTLEPVTAPESDGADADLVVAVRATAPYATQDALLVSGGAGGPRFSMRNKALDAAEVEAQLAGLPLPVVRVAQLDAGDDTPEELVLAFPDRSEVFALGLSCDGQRCTLSVRDALRLNNDRRAQAGGAFAADLNLDGFGDIVMQVQQVPAVQVAWGSADGLGPLRPLMGITIVGRDNFRPTLMALADIGGDARPDLIVSGTVTLVTGPMDSPTSERLYVPRRPYIRAGAADVDGDGLLDVYGVLDGSLEFLLTRDDGLFVESSSGITDVAAVQAADLDSNRFTDLVVQRNDGTLEAYFGTADGALSGRTTLGRFSGRAAWSIARLEDGRHADASDDVVLVDEGRLYAFAGSTQRVLTAPIPRATRPQGVAIGRFADGPGVFVAGRDESSARDDGLISAADLAGPTPAVRLVDAEGCAPDLLATGSTIRVVDWDGDGVQSALHYDEIRSEGGVVAAFQWVEVGPDAVRCRMVAPLPLRGRALAADRVDLDDDGAFELVAVIAETPRPDEPPVQQLAIWPIIEGQTVQPETRTAERPLDAGAFVDLGRGRRLVVASEGELLAVRRVDGVITFESMGAAPQAVVDAQAADVDGDGLDDVIFKTATSVLVLPQVACGARDAWDGVCAREEAW